MTALVSPARPAAEPTLAPPTKKNWNRLVAQYARSDLRRSLWQVANSFGPFLVTWVLMYLSLGVSYWLTLALALPAAGFLVRVFIILHDCGHGSFFKSQKANHFLGTIAGVFAFTPYYQWRHNHAIHHAHSGDLDRRATWDMPVTYTVKEYLALPRWKQIVYRVYRHPAVLFGIAPSILFILAQRLPSPTSGRRERWSVLFTNAALAALFAVLGYFLGFREVLAIQAPIMIGAATVGVWLFYIQHQYEDTYWEDHDEWSFTDAALKGSSYYRLPWLLRWFTGNIGLHHIHHLSTRIPNYALQRCHDDNPELQQVTTLTLLGSLRCASLRLWDEESKKLVGFDHLRRQAA